MTMANDLLSDSPKRDEFKLNLQQKRQATLLYHWMSLDYLKGLKRLLDDLIDGTGATLDMAQRQGRDAIMTSERWGVRNTPSNWSTYAFPALEDFRKSVVKDIAMRTTEFYDFTGANNCGRMLSEFSSMWMTPEEEEEFNKRFEEVTHHANFIDFATQNRHNLNNNGFAIYWQKFAHLFPRLPKFRVRTDVVGETGKVPPRTGVYVPQDDTFGTLQFAWTGGVAIPEENRMFYNGALPEAQTLNDLGRRMVETVGRNSAWVDGDKMATFTAEAFKRGEILLPDNFTAADASDPEEAPWLLKRVVSVTRPCAWYFVELVNGEVDDETEDALATGAQAVSDAIRVQAGQPCPRDGYYFTPAQTNSRRYFKQDDILPSLGGDYGVTIWQWDADQSKA